MGLHAYVRTHRRICLDILLSSSTYHTYTMVGLTLSFYSKIPCYPLHAWLLDAHVEATTEASVILAAVYLKVGMY